MTNNAIRQVFDSHTPALEPEVCQYLDSIVESALEDGDAADILDVLSNFLSEDETKQILSLLQASSGQCNDKTTNESISPQFMPPSKLNEPHSISVISPPTLHRTSSQPSNAADVKSSAAATKSQLRKEARLKKKNAKKRGMKGKVSPDISEQLVDDDHASAWKECTDSNQRQRWGGRGHGGRGVRITGDNYQNIHLPSVSLSYEGNELLVDSKMDIVKGHRYGLLGKNGVGKSTLLRQLASGSIPGLPRGMVIRMVKQQVEGRDDQTTLEALVEADEHRSALLREQDEVERKIDIGIDLHECAQRIGDIAVELDAIDADNAEKRAVDMLKGLSYTKEMIYGKTSHLSGGWRMRLALAQALFAPYSDLILLDECTNHLDLHGMAWLENYLTTKPLTIICVSHDRSFLDAVSTDIIVLEHKRLTYHAGNYTEYRKKMIKEKKLDRIGNYREDGKRFKQFSLKKLSEDHVRLAQKVVIEVDDPAVKLRLPDPSWPPCINDGTPLIQMEDVNFSYNTSTAEPDAVLVLKQLTLNITKKTKAAIVVKNGCGKSSLLKLLVGEVCLAKRQGIISTHPNIRVGFVSQYSVEELNQYAHMTVVEYAKEFLSSGDVCSSIISKASASGNIRQYLGMFGLGGDHAYRSIRALSGGERMRLCFATVLASTVHVLLLDEATNHIDLETMDSLSNAPEDWQGSVIMVSHNQGFLSGFCNELWSFSKEESGRVDISHDDTESFEELFLRYKSNMMNGVGGTSVTSRSELQNMAKRAARQNANVSRHAALL
mmetsp:Transcript_19129/g.32594  ORF Transcript_19129/g.32594 Transcript_19129/m.32594 type:complete len:777 (-) Transcript_19129:37-2367(-)